MAENQGDLFDEVISELPVQAIARPQSRAQPLSQLDGCGVQFRDDEESLRAYSAWREFDRLRGLLRFKPEPSSRITARYTTWYTARCAPDYFVLPLLAEHFTLRFGEVPWAIIDEKRRLGVFRNPGEAPRLIRMSPREQAPGGEPGRDSWEELWRNYFRSVNNESRNNPRLQKQFLPQRYRKYLTEMEDTIPPP
jgi:probable DNA metabolism protein